jgi:hypothetical protein
MDLSNLSDVFKKNDFHTVSMPHLVTRGKRATYPFL